MMEWESTNRYRPTVNRTTGGWPECANAPVQFALNCISGVARVPARKLSLWYQVRSLTRGKKEGPSDSRVGRFRATQPSENRGTQTSFCPCRHGDLRGHADAHRVARTR